MSMPHWNDPKLNLGTMKRVALWLIENVGEGEVFTKTQLREAFPETSQIDRRMRDLRTHGWRIDTNREDASLGSHEHRFVNQGAPVWEPGRGAGKVGDAVSAAERHTLLMEDGHKCRSCGIGPGEFYADTYVASQLDVARRPVRMPSGEVQIQKVIECNRCRVGGRELTADLADVLSRIANLSAYEQKMLSSWVTQDRRNFSETEQLWADYRTLPTESRNAVREALHRRVLGHLVSSNEATHDSSGRP